MAVAIIRRIKTKGSGGIIPASRVKPAMDKDLQELAALIKAFMITEAERGGTHRFRKDSSGIVGNTKVSFNTDGVEIKTTKYAQFLDAGRKPGGKKVPISVLIAWVKRYRVGGRNSRSGKFKKNVSVNSVAYAIQNAIHRNGIKARPFLTKTVAFAEQVVADAIDNIIIPDIITIIEFAFKKK